MPRGDKPTTVALALKDGWVYEDALPEMTKEQYDWWFNESLVLDGVRMGPPLTTNHHNEQSEAQIRLQDALKAVSEFCDLTQPFVGERFKKQLRNAIRAVPRSRAPVVAPEGDALQVLTDLRGHFGPSNCWCDAEGDAPHLYCCAAARKLVEQLSAAPSPASSPTPLVDAVIEIIAAEGGPVPTKWRKDAEPSPSVREAAEAPPAVTEAGEQEKI